MLIEVLKSKIHKAHLTHKNFGYMGSITIDEDLMDAAGLCEFEKVLVANFNNGIRYETYVIKGKRGSKIIGYNGAAARLGEIGDELIIMSFGLVENTAHTKPRIIIVDENNSIVQTL